MNTYNFTVIIVAAAIFVSGISQGEMIFETFDADPVLGDWSAQGTSTTWTYMPDSRRAGGNSGFLYGHVYRDNDDPAQYAVPITPIDKTTEFWIEMDIIHYECGLYQNVNIGVHNLSAANHETDMIAGRHNYARYTSFRGNRMDLFGYSSDGTEHYELSSFVHDPLIPGCDYGQPQRAKIHYWYESATDEGFAMLEVYSINGDGTLGDFLYGSAGALSDLIEPDDAFYGDAFGLFNRTSGSHSNSYHNINEYDNLYYSTEGWNQNPVAPDFVPEPASMMLLGGGLLLMRKRSK
jgi:hypothetical protein